jgi:type IV secretion system protein VirB11
VSAVLDHLLEPISKFLDAPGVEEICCQAPGEAWIFSEGGWQRHQVDGLDADRIEEIAWVAAALRNQDVNEQKPVLDTDLNGRGRLFAVVHPCVERGKPALTIRLGGNIWPTLKDQAKRGLFDKVKRKHVEQVNPELLELYEKEDMESFLELACAEGLTIVGCGLTGSGKTYTLRSMIRALRDPTMRIVTIQDTQELRDLEQFFPNSVQLFYDSNDTKSGIDAARLVEAAMRMRPAKLVLQEVKNGQAAVSMVTALQTGHTGFTTVHASNCLGAFERLKFIAKQTDWGRAMTDIEKELQKLVDVVIHHGRNGRTFSIDEVWFRHAGAVAGHSNEEGMEGDFPPPPDA